NHPRSAVAQPRITQIRVGRSGDRAEGRRGAEVHLRQAQVSVIEKVEGLYTELRREAVVELRHLAHGKIHDVQSWSDNRVAPGGAERSGRRRRGGRLFEEPRGGGLGACFWVTAQVGAVVEFARPAHVRF